MQSLQSSQQPIWPWNCHEPIEDSSTRIQDRKGKSSRNPCQISQREKFWNKPQLKKAPPENQTAKEANPSPFHQSTQSSTTPPLSQTSQTTTELTSELSVAAGVESWPLSSPVIFYWCYRRKTWAKGSVKAWPCWKNWSGLTLRTATSISRTTTWRKLHSSIVFDDLSLPSCLNSAPTSRLPIPRPTPTTSLMKVCFASSGITSGRTTSRSPNMKN